MHPPVSLNWTQWPQLFLHLSLGIQPAPAARGWPRRARLTSPWCCLRVSALRTKSQPKNQRRGHRHVWLVGLVLVPLLLSCSTRQSDGRRFKPLGRNGQGCDEVLWLMDSSVMVRVPAGEFTMGSGDDSSDARPVHEVFLGEFYIDKYEVTNRQYKRFCDATGRSYPPVKELGSLQDYFTRYPEHPVVAVSWDDAAAYCNWVGKRLPSEAEWERAARGTDARKYPWGNEEPDADDVFRANCGEGQDRSLWERDGYQFTSPVGSFAQGASACGCLDVAGNVREWCNDRYESGYSGSAAGRNPAGPNSGMYRVVRGGSWTSGNRTLRCASRFYLTPANRNIHSLGFRCAWRR